MTNPSPPKRQKTNDGFDMNLPLTQLAVRYTHPTGKEDKPLRNYPHKSGITPIIEEAWKTQEQFNEWHALDAYQRERFNGRPFYQVISTNDIHEYDGKGKLTGHRIHYCGL